MSASHSKKGPGTTLGLTLLLLAMHACQAAQQETHDQDPSHALGDAAQDAAQANQQAAREPLRTPAMDFVADGMLQIEAGAFNFDARVAGPRDGEGVLLLHGFPETHHSYRHQIDVLARAGYRAVAPNQRGYSPGARPDDVEQYRLPLLVEDVILMADALGFERFHLVGHDWGAAVAWYVAAAHPERLLSLCTISVPHPAAFAEALNDPESGQRRMSRYMDFFRSVGSENALTENGAGALRQMYAELDQADAQVYVAALGTPAALRGGLNWYRANQFDVSPTLGPITTPTLFVWSDGDSALGRYGAEACGDFVQGPYRFEIIEGVSHWVLDLAPEQLNGFLLEHLRANPDLP